MVWGCFTKLYQALLLIFTLVAAIEGKTCIKREEIGYRENNHYECNHPVYSECCEHGGRFTCCEPLLSKNIREQIQLWGLLLMMLAVGTIVYTCLVRDTQLIRSNTLQEAVTSLSHRLGRRESKTKGGLEKTSVRESDHKCLI